MSTAAVDRFRRSAPVAGAFDRKSSKTAFRAMALGCSLLLVTAYVRVLAEVTTVVGGTARLLVIVALAIVAGTLAAVSLDERTTAVVAAVALLGGFVYYVNAADVGVSGALSGIDVMLSDAITLATGVELLRMVEAGSWATAFAPTPAFLTWYLVLRRRYALAVVPAGFALVFLVLTTDAWTAVTLAGTVAGIGVVAFGELEFRDGSLAQADLLALLLAAVLVLSLTVPLVPGGSASPTYLVEGEDASSLEGAVVGEEDTSTIQGEVSLSPEVRFTIESEEPSYWRTGVYDRFTGDEWISTGEASAYDGPLDHPPGETVRVEQEVFVEETIQAMPVVNHPIEIGDGAQHLTEVTANDQFRPTVPLEEGDSFSVTSTRLNAHADDLTNASTEYPADVEERYLQLPEDTSSAFEDRTSEIVADAETPYETAATIESYLRSEYDYSLDVDLPEGNVANEFLLEMDAGYCVYFATTMVQMLRAEEIPARYVTGYSTGQQVDDDRWVVRGLDAHAWVEVYFPEYGWVEFEPTPPADRNAFHDDRLQEARILEESGVDTEESEGVAIQTDRDTMGTDILEAEPGSEDNQSFNETDREDNQTDPGTDINESDILASDWVQADDPGDDEPDDEGPSIPPPEQLAFVFVVLLGVAAGAHRVGAKRQLHRELRLHWQRPTDAPNDDAERAYQRLELVLARRYRPRRTAETPREYLGALSVNQELDPRIRDVVAIRERATFGNGVDRAAASSAIDDVDSLSRAVLPVVGRLYR